MIKLNHEQDLLPSPSCVGPVAWLGQAGLYRTRVEAVQNGEQQLKPVSANELYELARSHALEECIHA